MGGQPALQQLSDGDKRRGPAGGALPGVVLGELGPAQLGVSGGVLKCEGSMHGPAGYGVDADADLRHAGAAFAPRAGT
jgi:hypothetical protein